MYKKFFYSLGMILCVTFIARAQESKPFEGEILYETYENCSDYIKEMGNSIYFDGVHQVRLILKGNKMHLIDETTKCHILADADIALPASKRELTKAQEKNGNAYVHYCDMTKTGMDFTKLMSMMAVLAPWPPTYPDGSKGEPFSYTFAKKDKTKVVLDETCSLYEGDISYTAGTLKQKYFVQAYVSDIEAPAGYPWSLYGLQIPGIAMQWIQKYDGGHVSGMGVGEVSYYMEADVTKIIPRSVSDDEFVIPSGYKIKDASNVFSQLNYYKSVKKQLIKLGIKGGDNSQKSTGVHYKTDGEWDF
ncbi:MAG: hypothetical protein LBM06_03690 [Prevotellaceae bacterium]|jgi:hypothetical protein|nr:hypothetical protein [Prevotellaceae bacterium]